MRTSFASVVSPIRIKGPAENSVALIEGGSCVLVFSGIFGSSAAGFDGAVC